MHVVGLLPDPPRCPPCRGAGRRTRNGPDGPRPQAADNKVPGNKVPGNKVPGHKVPAQGPGATRSTTLAAVSTANTRLERHFDPTAVHELKAAASTDLTVGGANLAARAFKARLVDECQLFVWPMVVGGGKPALPTGTRAELELLDERGFGNGVVYLRYRPLGQ